MGDFLWVVFGNYLLTRLHNVASCMRSDANFNTNYFIINSKIIRFDWIMYSVGSAYIDTYIHTQLAVTWRVELR